MTYLIVKL